jgi:hypothetical protein
VASLTRHDHEVWRRRAEPSEELLAMRADLWALTGFVMGIDAKLNLIIGILEDDDGEEEADRADT